MGHFSPTMYFLGTALLVPGGYDLLPDKNFKQAILFYIIACSILAFIGLWDFLTTFYSKAFANNLEKNIGVNTTEEFLANDPTASFSDMDRVSSGGLTYAGSALDVSVTDQALTYEDRNICCGYWDRGMWIAFFYFCGGFLFDAGAVLYWPELPADGTDWTGIGTKVFRAGSCAYLCGSFLSLYGIFCKQETERSLQAPSIWFKCIPAMALIIYVIGAFGYIAGGILYEQKEPEWGAWTWLVSGSFFFLGASLLLAKSIKDS